MEYGLPNLDFGYQIVYKNGRTKMVTGIYSMARAIELAERAYNRSRNVESISVGYLNAAGWHFAI